MGVRSFLSRAEPLARWLFYDQRVVWLTLLVILGAVALSIRPGATELQVRWTAVVLQLFGFGQVAWGIRETRKLFGLPSFMERARVWWRRRPTGSKRIHVGSGHVVLGPLTATATATVRRNPQPDAPLEERVQALEHNFGQLDAQFEAAILKAKRAAQEQGERLESESRQRTEGDAAILRKMEAQETGGLALSAVGAVILAIGILLGTFPEEIAGWMDHSCSW